MHLSMFLLAILTQQHYGIPYGEKEKCTVLRTGDPSRYVFVKTYEVSTGQVIFQSTLRGGQSIGIFVKSDKIKIEHKWAGDLEYHSAVVANCDRGNTISY